MTKTARDILKSAYYRGLDKTGYSDAELESDLKEIEAIMSEQVIGEDFDIPAEMEKVGRDFQKLDAIAKTGGLLNNHKSDIRKRLQTALYGKENKNE